MQTVSLEAFLSERGLSDDPRIADALNEITSRLPLAALRERTNLTQKEIATAIGVSQAAVSKFEGRGDFLLSTLFQYVKAIRGKIELTIEVGEDCFSMTPYEEDGHYYFSLLKEKASKHTLTSLQPKYEKLRAFAQCVDERAGAMKKRTSFQQQPQREKYATAPAQIISLLAANDETKSIAA